MGKETEGERLKRETDEMVSDSKRLLDEIEALKAKAKKLAEKQAAFAKLVKRQK